MDLLSIGLVVFYSVLIFYLFRYWKQLGTSQLPLWVFATLFSFKAVCGIVNYMYFYEYVGGGDAIFYTKDCYRLCASLYDDPSVFWNELKYWPQYPGRFDILDRSSHFWEELGVNLHWKIIMVLTLLSFGKPFVVALLFSFLSFIGQSFLWKAFVHFQPNKKWLFLIAIFLIPTVSFWTAGIAKETYILLGLGIVIFYTTVFKSAKGKRKWGALLLIILGFLLLFVVRNFFVLSLLPFYLLWILSYSMKSIKVAWLYLGILLISGVLFLSSSLLPPENPLNVYKRFADRQTEFLKISKDGSSVNLTSIENIKDLPKASLESVANTMFRPYPSDISKSTHFLAFLDTYTILILLLLSIWLISKPNIYSPFFFFILSYTCVNIFLIGLTIPNLGAISRYKSVFIMLLLAAFFMINSINSNFIKRIFTKYQ